MDKTPLRLASTESILGIELSRHAVRLAVVQKPENTWIVTQAAVVSPPRGQGELSQNQVVSLIRDTLHDLQVSAKYVYLSLPGQEASVYMLSFPFMQKNEVHTAVEAQLMSILETEDLDSYYWEYVEASYTDENQIRVWVVLVKRAVVDGRLEMLTSLGLRPLGVVFAPFSCWNLITYVASDKEKNSLVLHIDSQGADIGIFSGEILNYYRRIPLPENELMSLFTSETTSETETPVLQVLVSEVQRSIDYAKVHNLVSDIPGIFLCGDFENMDVLLPFLKGQLHQEVTRLNPFPLLGIQSDISNVIRNLGPQISVAVGSALQPSRLVFLPERYKKIAKIRTKKPIRFPKISLRIAPLMILAIALLNIPIIYSLHMSRQISKYQEALANLEHGMQQIDHVRNQQKAKVAKHEEVASKLGFLAPIHTWMNDIRQVIPPAVVLSQIQYFGKDKRFEISGISYYDKGKSEEKISVFMRSLEDMPNFEDIRLSFFHSRLKTKKLTSAFFIEAEVAETQNQIVQETRHYEPEKR